MTTRARRSSVRVAPAAVLLLVIAVGLASCAPRDVIGKRSSSAGLPASTFETDEDDLPDELVGVEWYALPTKRKIVALTFDCGANADGIPAILRTLARKKAPATFFLTGRWADSFTTEAASLGSRYAVGNHTYDHPDLTELDRDTIRRQIRKGHRRIVLRAGVDPRPLFRYPFGAGDARTLRIVNRRGYGSIRWTIDTLGWKGADAGITRKSIVKRVMAGLRPGAVVLMHVGSAPDGSTLDADVLPRLVRKIRAAGYRFVRLDRFVASKL